jgi:hypothetical protein
MSISNRRFSVLLRHLKLIEDVDEEQLFMQISNTNLSTSKEHENDKKITLGDISLTIEPNLKSELIPFDVTPYYLFFNDQTSNQELLRHLKWMMQKEQLNQDVKSYLSIFFMPRKKNFFIILSHF